MNVFDWRGPEFLAFYVAFAIAGLVAGWLTRRILAPGDDRVARRAELSPLAIAYLARGARGALEAALARLIRDEAISASRAALQIKGPLPAQAAPLEQAVYAATATATDDDDEQDDESWASIQFAQLQTDTQTELDRLRDQLIEERLLPARAVAKTVHRVRIALLAVVLLTGLIKIIVGTTRDRPVVFLVLLTIVAALGGIVAIARGRHVRTVAGDAYLARAKHDNAALETTGRTDNSRLTGDDAAMAVALFGGAMLIGDLGGVGTYFSSPAVSGAATGHGCGGGGCGGGGCGGGCGGCGS